MRKFLGKMLKNDVVNAFGVTVLPARTVLQEEHLVMLENHKIDDLSVFLDIVEIKGKKENYNSACSRRGCCGKG